MCGYKIGPTKKLDSGVLKCYSQALNGPSLNEISNPILYGQYALHQLELLLEEMQASKGVIMH